MTFDEFRKTCFHTKKSLKIPILDISVNKVKYLMTNNKYDLSKEHDVLMKLYDKHRVVNK